MHKMQIWMTYSKYRFQILMETQKIKMNFKIQIITTKTIKIMLTHIYK